MIFEILEDCLYEAQDIWREAKHDWRFAKRQMDTIQSKSLYREED